MVFYLPGMPLQSYYFPDKQKKSPIFHLTGVQYGRFFLYDFIFSYLQTVYTLAAIPAQWFQWGRYAVWQ